MRIFGEKKNKNDVTIKAPSGWAVVKTMACGWWGRLLHNLLRSSTKTRNRAHVSHTIFYIVYNNNIRDNNIKTALLAYTGHTSTEYIIQRVSSCKCNIIVYNKNEGSVAHFIKSIIVRTTSYHSTRHI